MAAKRIKRGDEARAALLAGIDAVADAVAVTLGPRGRYVILDRRGDPMAGDPGGLTVTNDGVTIADELELFEPFANQGARLVREVAGRTGAVAGDGTTTATLLARAIAATGLANVSAGAEPVALRRGIEAAAGAVARRLARIAIDVGGPEWTQRVAGAAAKDEELAVVVAEAFEAVGAAGVITVDPGKDGTTALDVTAGTKVWNGYLSPRMVTDPDRGEAVLDEPYLLITDRELDRAAQIAPVLDRVAATGRPLIVIGPAIAGEALATLVGAKLRGDLACAAVKARFIGTHRSRHLEDLAILTGGEVIEARLGMSVEAAPLEQLGAAQRIVVDRSAMTIIEGAGDPDAVEARIGALRAEAERAPSDWDRDRIRERIAHLSGVVAVIEVGAPTETEITERRLRAEDAVLATRAALEEGIVPGGGVALLRAREAIDELELSGDEATGAAIVRRALAEPLRRLALNSGLEPSTAIERVAALGPREGLDAATGDYRDLVEAGVIDPTKVVRTALENAASIAKTVLLAECVVVEDRPPEPPPDPRIKPPDPRARPPDPRAIPAKQMRFGGEARGALATGVEAVSRAVGATLGPQGRNVLLARRASNGDLPDGSGLTITADGVTVAREVDLADPFADQGGHLLREVAGATNDEAGDGTTTATLLAQAMVREGVANIAAGAEPVAIRRGIVAAVGLALEAIGEASVTISAGEETARVAAVSAGDETIGTVVGRAFDAVGLDGIVTVEPGQTLDIGLEVALGMSWAQGYLARDMATDPGARQAVLEHPYVLLTDRRLRAADDLVPILDRVAETGRPLLVVAGEVTDEALRLLTANKVQGRLACAAVRPPDFLANRLRNLEDMAILTGGEVASDESAVELRSLRLDQLGEARRVTASLERTTILGGGGDPEAVERRAAAIRAEIERVRFDFERGRLAERLARLVSGVAVIEVGAPTETEITERRLRAEDAVLATRAALEEGIVPGGGVALLRAREAIDELELSGDEATGAAIVRRALAEPLRRLALNSGLEPSTAIERVAALGPREGLDAATGDYRDLVEAGVIDPTKVVRTALENAASIAKTVLLAECAAAYAPEK